MAGGCPLFSKCAKRYVKRHKSSLHSQAACRLGAQMLVCWTSLGLELGTWGLLGSCEHPEHHHHA